MLFADQTGQGKVRAPGEMAGLIIAALSGRNFSFAGQSKSTKFNIVYDAKSVESGSEGSRSHPIRVSLPSESSMSFNIQVTVEDGDELHFQFPMTVKVQLRGGPLQGAIHWQGEDSRVHEYRLQGPGEVLSIDLTVDGRCDEVNRGDGSCVDFASVQLWSQGASSTIGKKRFYVRWKSQQGAQAKDRKNKAPALRNPIILDERCRCAFSSSHPRLPSHLPDRKPMLPQTSQRYQKDDLRLDEVGAPQNSSGTLKDVNFWNLP